MPMSGLLVDSYGRSVEYLRVSITDLCNLRCVYCRPPEGVQLVSHDEILRYEEILTIVGVAQELGIRKIRITGGEPLVRRGVLDFIAKISSLNGIDDLAITTNGALLVEMAADLKAAGLTRINVSLDSLRAETFRAITGRDLLDRVLRGIETALNVGPHPVQIHAVLLQGINEQDVPAFARLTLDKPIDVRFIERMPFGVDWVPEPPDSFSAHTVVKIIQEQIGELHEIKRDPLSGPATMFRLEGAKGRIGIIDAMTGHLCGTCNRLRLTARGTLRPCLLAGNEIDIRGPLRAGATREEVAQIILAAVSAKPMGNASCAMPKEGMNMIGG